MGNAIRALSTCYLPIYPATIMDAFEVMGISVCVGGGGGGRAAQFTQCMHAFMLEANLQCPGSSGHTHIQPHTTYSHTPHTLSHTLTLLHMQLAVEGGVAPREMLEADFLAAVVKREAARRHEQAS